MERATIVLYVKNGFGTFPTTFRRAWNVVLGVDNNGGESSENESMQFLDSRRVFDLFRYARARLRVFYRQEINLISEIIAPP